MAVIWLILSKAMMRTVDLVVGTICILDNASFSAKKYLHINKHAFKDVYVYVFSSFLILIVGFLSPQRIREIISQEI